MGDLGLAERRIPQKVDVWKEDRWLYLAALGWSAAPPALWTWATAATVFGNYFPGDGMAACGWGLTAQWFLIFPLAGALLSTLQSQARIPLTLLLMGNLGASVLQMLLIICVQGIGC